MISTPKLSVLTSLLFLAVVAHAQTGTATASALNTTLEGLTGCTSAGYVHTPAGADCVAAATTAAGVGTLINQAQYDILYSAGTTSAVAGAAINGFQYDSTTGNPAAATATQLGTLANQAQYAIILSGGTTSALTSLATSSTTGAILASGGSSANPAYDTHATLSVGALSLGAAGTAGSIVLGGSSSGTATINTSSTGTLQLPSGTTATSMSLTTPVLGTPTSGTITNLTGTCTSCTASNATIATNQSGGTVSATSITDTGAESATFLTTSAAGLLTKGACTGPSSWTPADNSSASLTFTSVSGTYEQCGFLVIAFYGFTYPSTSSSAATSIKGLPVASSGFNYFYSPVRTSGTVTNGPLLANMPASVSTFGFQTSQATSIVTNASLSTQAVQGTLYYFSQ